MGTVSFSAAADCMYLGLLLEDNTDVKSGVFCSVLYTPSMSELCVVSGQLASRHPSAGCRLATPRFHLYSA